jgi:hypothetical protein
VRYPAALLPRERRGRPHAAAGHGRHRHAPAGLLLQRRRVRRPDDRAGRARTRPRPRRAPTGAPKLVGEWMVADAARSQASARSACATSTSWAARRPSSPTARAATCSPACSTPSARAGGPDRVRLRLPHARRLRRARLHPRRGSRRGARRRHPARRPAGPARRPTRCSTSGAGTATRCWRSCAPSPRSPASTRRRWSCPGVPGTPAASSPTRPGRRRCSDGRPARPRDMVTSAWEAELVMRASLAATATSA